MKKSIQTLLILLSTQLFSNELAWVDEQVEAIKPPRKGISIHEISKLKDPFIFLKSKKSQQKAKPSNKKRPNSFVKKKKKVLIHSPKFTLEAILNKTALINGQWHKEGETIDGYKIEKVSLQSVLLTLGKKQILLSTMSKSNNLKFNNK